jgi:hypothetical protein
MVVAEVRLLSDMSLSDILAGIASTLDVVDDATNEVTNEVIQSFHQQ